MNIEDKENFNPALFHGRKCIPQVAEGKKGKPASGRGFNRLLTDVTNSIRDELDHCLATKTQDKDANELIAEWVREQKDSKLAQKVAKELDDEVRSIMKQQLDTDEEEALRIAIEERRRLQDMARQRRELEEKDCHYASNLMADLELNDEKQREICREEDERYAKYVQDMMQDEILAEELQHSEREEAQVFTLLKAQATESDEKLAREYQDAFEKESRLQLAKQEEDDYQLALSEQKSVEKEYKTEKEQLAARDAVLSRKLDIKVQREDHRHRKFRELVADANVDTTEAGITHAWMNAAAVVEDVAGGICMTVLLPHIKSLNVTLQGKRRVSVDAVRMVFAGETTAVKENTNYSIDFNIEGKLLALTQNDISYEYSSEFGLLHVYVEKVHLESDQHRGADSKKSHITQVLKKGLSKIFFGSKSL